MSIPKWIIAGLVIVAFIGFLDATYLTIQHYRGEVPPCSILQGCEQVTTSKYAVVYDNIPLALVGSVFYFIVLGFLALYLDMRKMIILNVVALLAIGGFLSSVYFVYLQLYVIQAICMYCMISAASSTLLFLLSMILQFKKFAQQ